MNVFDMRTGRVKFVNPEFEDIAGKCSFPGWFVHQASLLMASKEPYAVAAGVGLVGRLSPFVASNYDDINRGGDAKALPLWHVFEWAERVAKPVRASISEAFVYEIDDITDGFDILKRLYERNATACESLSRALKQRRDDLESVGFVCLAMGCAELINQTKALDALAQQNKAYLNDGIRQGLEPRLYTIGRYLSNRWWGVVSP